MPIITWFDVLPGKFRRTLYTLPEINTALQGPFELWAMQNQAAYRTNVSYDPNDPFTFNYAGILDATGEQLPGSWRAIYRYYFDTDHPHSCPWEMLGFSTKPSWWETQYGPAPYTSGNIPLWDDIENGIIRQGPRQGQDTSFARPGLQAKYLPVNEYGELLDPIVAGIVPKTSQFDTVGANWEFGQTGPIENVWRRSETYAFSQTYALFLLRPVQLIELGWDPLHEDYIYQGFGRSDPQFINTIYLRRPPNSLLQVHGEENGSINNSGVQAFVAYWLQYNNKDITTNFGDFVRGLDVRLSHRMAGFIHSDTLTAITDNFGLIPVEDISTNLYTSQSIFEAAYSGIIIVKVDNGYQVWGYDTICPMFHTIPGVKTGPSIQINAGLREPTIKIWLPNHDYFVGDIVSYTNLFYKVLQNLNSGAFFEPTKYLQIPTPQPQPVVTAKKYLEPVPGLPIIDFEYGTIFPVIQDVVNFLSDYERWLIHSGWVFNDSVEGTNSVSSDFTKAAENFLNWTINNWSTGTVLALSPLSALATFQSNFGAIASVEQIINGTYSILNREGINIDSKYVTATRFENRIQVQIDNPNENTGIYALRLYLISYEHAITFANNTVFGDIIYSPLLNLRQARIHIDVKKSRGWIGRFDAPGHLISASDMDENIEATANGIRRYFDLNHALDTAMLPAEANHLIGYQQRDYLDSLFLSNLSQINFYQGLIKAKGTKTALSALLRSSYITQISELNFFEEWAFKIGSYGANATYPSLELNITDATLKSNPQLFVFNAITQEEWQKLLGIGGDLTTPDAYASQLSTLITTPPFDTTYNLYDYFANTFSVEKIEIINGGASYPASATLSLNLILGTPAQPAVIEIKTNANGTIISAIVIAEGSYYDVPGLTTTAVDVDLVGPLAARLSNGFGLQLVVTFDVLTSNRVISKDPTWNFRPGNLNPMWPLYNVAAPTADIVYFTNYLPNAGFVLPNEFKGANFDIPSIFSTTTTWALGDHIWIYNSPGSNAVLNPIYTFNWTVGRVTNPFMKLLQVIASQPVGAFVKLLVDNLAEMQPNLYIYISQTTYTDTDLLGWWQVQSVKALTPSGNLDPTIDTLPPNPAVDENYNITADGTFLGSDLTVIAGQRIMWDSIAWQIIAPATAGYIQIPISINTNVLYPVTNVFSKVVVGPILVYMLEEARFPDYATLLTHTNCVNGEIFYVDNASSILGTTTPAWAAFQFQDGAFILLRQQLPRIRTNLFTNALLSNNLTNEISIIFEVYDPYKGIVPGIADREIYYKLNYDPAKYTNGENTDILVQPDEAWGEVQVGRVWWDVSQVRYYDYEQGSAQERKNLWGSLCPNTDVVLYEWMRSPVPPSQWNTLVQDPTGKLSAQASGIPSGTPRNLTEYSVQQTFDDQNKVIDTFYYFWVRGTLYVPTVPFRKIATKEAENVLRSPTANNIAWFSPIDNSSFIISGIAAGVTTNPSILQVNWRLLSYDDTVHNQYILLRQGDPASLPPDELWNKMRDSLVGYDQYGDQTFPPSPEFSNSTNVTYPLLVPDPSLSPGEKLGTLVRPRQSWFNNICSAKAAFVDSVNSILSKIRLDDERPGWDSNLYQSSPLPHANHTVPDLKTFYQDIQLGVITFGDTVLILGGIDTGNFWLLLQYFATGPELIGYQRYAVKDFVDRVNWYSSDVNSAIMPSVVYPDIATRDGNTAILGIGTIVKVDNAISGRWAWYRLDELSNGLRQWTIVAEQNGTAALSSKFADHCIFPHVAPFGLYFDKSLAQSLNSGNWDITAWDEFRWDQFTASIQGNLFDFRNAVLSRDGSLELSIIIEQLKDVILLPLEQNKLFFDVVNFVHTEQNVVEWAFKTSFMVVNGLSQALGQTSIQQPDLIESLLSYIDEATPYHTAVREFTSTFTGFDLGNFYATDFDNPVYFDPLIGQYRILDPNNPEDQKIFLSKINPSPLLSPAEADEYFNNPKQTVSYVSDGSTIYLFPAPVTTPSLVEVTVGGNQLVPNVDFVVGPQSVTLFVPPVVGATIELIERQLSGPVTITAHNIWNDWYENYLTHPELIRHFAITIKFDRVSSIYNPAGWDVGAWDGSAWDLSLSWDTNPWDLYYTRLSDETGPTIVTFVADGVNSTFKYPDTSLYTFDVTWTKDGIDFIRLINPETTVGTIVSRDKYDVTSYLVGTQTHYQIVFTFTPASGYLIDVHKVLNAADRILRYYVPLDGMPVATDPELMGGSAYDGTVELGVPFRSSNTLDINIQGGTFLIPPPNGDPDIWVAGNTFLEPNVAWNRPEELVVTKLQTPILMDVYTQPAPGQPTTRRNRFLGDGVTTTYSLVQLPQTIESVAVFANGLLLEPTTNYNVNWVQKTITFVAPTVSGTVYELVSMGWGGTARLINSFYSNGANTISTFVLKEIVTTVNARVTSNGVLITGTTVSILPGPNSNETQITVNLPAAVAPGNDVFFNLFDSSSGSETLIVRDKFTAAGGSETFILSQNIGSEFPDWANVLVFVNGARVGGPWTTYYIGDGINNIFAISITPVISTNVHVYLDGIEIANGVDYIVGGGNVTITVPPAFDVKIVVELREKYQFRTVAPNQIVFDDSAYFLSAADNVVVYSFNDDASLEAETSRFIGSTSGQYILQQAPWSQDYIWVWVNGAYKVLGVDYIPLTSGLFWDEFDWDTIGWDGDTSITTVAFGYGQLITDTVIITITSAPPAADAVAWRMFVTDKMPTAASYKYWRINNYTTGILKEPINFDSTQASVYISGSAPAEFIPANIFDMPNITEGTFSSIWVDGEKFDFAGMTGPYGPTRVGSYNDPSALRDYYKLTNLRRGSEGTSWMIPLNKTVARYSGNGSIAGFIIPSAVIEQVIVEIVDQTHPNITKVLLPDTDYIIAGNQVILTTPPPTPTVGYNFNVIVTVISTDWNSSDITHNIGTKVLSANQNDMFVTPYLVDWPENKGVQYDIDSASLFINDALGNIYK